MAKTVIEKSERKTLKVTWVAPEPETFGKGGIKLLFNCTDNLQYETLHKSLFDAIKVGAELDADTELKVITTDDEKIYKHWIVNQIYVDGIGIVKPKTAQSGYKSYGKSKEELTQQRELEEAKRRSIEAQSALIQAVELAKADKVTMQGPQDLKPIMLVAREFFQLLQSLTKTSEVLKTTEPPQLASVVPKVPLVTPKAVIPKAREVVPEPEEPPLKNVGELLTRCKDNKIPRSEVFEILSIGSPTEIADLEEAWQIVKKAKEPKPTSEQVIKEEDIPF